MYCLDLDRTTLDGDGYLPEENRKALEEVMEKGVQVVVASGRALSTLPAAIREMEGIRYAITSNGAAVYELHTGKCLKQYKMTEESVRRILTLTRNFPVTYEAFVDGEAYAPRLMWKALCNSAPVSGPFLISREPEGRWRIFGHLSVTMPLYWTAWTS